MSQVLPGFGQLAAGPRLGVRSSEGRPPGIFLLDGHDSSLQEAVTREGRDFLLQEAS